MTISVVVWMPFSDTWRHSHPVSSSSVWTAGYDSTLYGMLLNSLHLRILAISQSDLFSPNLFWMATLHKTIPYSLKISQQLSLNRLASHQWKWQYNIINNSMINHLIIITCVHVCASMFPPTQTSNLHATNLLDI